jgi:sugar lactone lactonase YvrE
MKCKRVLALPVTLIFSLLLLASTAAADGVVSERGEGAGKVGGTEGLAVNFETGRLYVADAGNNRVDVFDAEGHFEKAFGWGVVNGVAEPQACTTTCHKGLAGAGSGQLSRPSGIAVDNSAGPSHGDIYVVDLENRRVEKFDEAGNFVLTFGGGVDKTVPGNVCTEASAHVCGAGSNGFGSNEFNSGSSKISIAVGSSGDIYVGDSKAVNEVQGLHEARIQVFAPSGVLVEQHILGQGKFDGSGSQLLAVDSTGSVYVNTIATGGGLRKYDASWVLINDLTTGKRIDSIAVDSSDDLFVSELDGEFRPILEYSPSGLPIRRFGYGASGFGHPEVNLSGLAPHQSAGGDIYVAEDPLFGNRGAILQLAFPPAGPLVIPEPCQAKPLGNVKATLDANVNPEGKATAYHFEYVTDATFQQDVTNLGAGHGFDHASRAPTQAAEDPTLPGDFVAHKAGAEAALKPSTEYHCRVLAENADSTVTGPEGTFTSLPPLQIGSTWASEVGLEGATLNATVNPLGIPTTGYFEYVSEATYLKDIAELGAGHGFDHATKAPDVPVEAPIGFGAGEALKAGSATIADLSRGTAYRYRILATDPDIPQPIAGPTKAFRTFSAGEGGLPDSRAYELVSPAQKGSAEVGIPAVAGGLFFEEKIARINASSSSDTSPAVTYTSWTSFGNAQGAPGASQYLSKRSASGWTTQNVSPLGFGKNPLKIPYRGFTPDLGFSSFVIDQPALTPEAQEGFQNLYLRDNTTGALQALTVEAPQFTPINDSVLNDFCASFGGASVDGKRVFFSADGAMAGAPAGTGFSLYEWSAAGGLRLVSVLPGETPAPANPSTRFGADGGLCSMDHGIIAHAVSEDGKVAFWSYGGKISGAEKPLLARIEGSETIELDAKETGANAGKGPAGHGTFWAASADGSRALFTAPGKLTKDAGGEGHLYRYDTETRSLADLTPGAVVPEIEGVIGASEDETYAYFVARGALTGEQQGAGGKKAKKGENNLYLYHQGEGLRFIGALLGLDENDWSNATSSLNASVTPDGRHLAFLSVESEALSGYDNTIASGTVCQPSAQNSLAGDPRCAEAYLYDAEAHQLTCASCNPSGARPTGPAQLPFWSNPFEGPRYLSEDGSKLFFESRDVLSGDDRNKRRDVYEFEAAGKGSCSGQSPDFDPASGGCLFLISSGQSEDETYLLDASASGRDVFIATRSQLSGWDTNQNYDVYDAREAGGFPGPPTERTPCEGEACKPPANLAPSAAPPGTPDFQGPGNVAQKPSKPRKPHKAKKHKPKPKRHAKKQHRASHQGRAGR